MKTVPTVLLVALVCVTSCGCATRSSRFDVALSAQASGTDASLRGLCVVNDRVVWASGSGGTVLRTTDGGASWERLTVAGAETLDFRDVQAFGAESAVIATAGQPARLYRTADGGATWDVVYENTNKAAFFNAMAFWDRRLGLAVSDAVDGRLLIVRTEDGGRSWTEVDGGSIPPALEGEIGFAASGTCLCVASDGRAWIALGGATGRDGARVMRSLDHGRTWSATTTPVLTGESSGIFSLAFANARTGVIVGGDYALEDEADRNAAWSEDGGLTWGLAETLPRGYRSVVATIGFRSPRLVAAGPTGIDWSSDGGRTWRPLADEGYHALAFSPSGESGWAVGSDGRVSRITPID